MNREEQQAILTISLMAAFADGRKDELERAELKRITGSLSGADLNAAALYQDVLLKRRALDDVARALASPELRQYAYEMAVAPFMLASLAGRGARFFLVAGLVAWGGPRVAPHLRRYIEVVGWVVAAVILGAIAWLNIRR